MTSMMRMTSSTQVCRKCLTDKPLEAYHSDRRTANRKRTICIECRQHQRSVINLTRFEYAQLLVKQNNCCAICGIEATQLQRELGVDHNHDTDQIRGLLCAHCNFGLGNFKDDVELLKLAIEYLNFHNGAA